MSKSLYLHLRIHLLLSLYLVPYIAVAIYVCSIYMYTSMYECKIDGGMYISMSVSSRSRMEKPLYAILHRARYVYRYTCFVYLSGYSSSFSIYRDRCIGTISPVARLVSMVLSLRSR